MHDAADIDGNLPALRTDLRAEVIIIITYRADCMNATQELSLLNSMS